MIDAPLEGKNRKPIDKPCFLFGLMIVYMMESISRFARSGVVIRFSPNMERYHPCIYLQFVYVPRSMNWHLTKAQDEVLLGGFSSNGAYPLSKGRHVLGLLPRSWKKEFPLGETLLIANTFIHQLVDARGEFPCQDFHPLGWDTVPTLVRFLLPVESLD